MSPETEKALYAYLRAVVNALDADQTNMVRCDVGDLGVEHEDAIRRAVFEIEADKS